MYCALPLAGWWGTTRRVRLQSSAWWAPTKRRSHSFSPLLSLRPSWGGFARGGSTKDSLAGSPAFVSPLLESLDSSPPSPPRVSDKGASPDLATLPRDCGWRPRGGPARSFLPLSCALLFSSSRICFFAVLLSPFAVRVRRKGPDDNGTSFGVLCERGAHHSYVSLYFIFLYALFL